MRHSLLPEPTHCERVVCLTEEPTEILYRLGAEDRVVAISGFTQRPPRARNKPKLSTFLDANIDAICDLKPDIVIGFSDLQAAIADALIRRGVPVLILNQRSIAEILQATLLIGETVGEGQKARALASEMRSHLLAIAAQARDLPTTPRVFFEEWPEPQISGIRWVSELIEICGGTDIASFTRAEQGAKGRILEPTYVAAHDPDVIVASWCGKMVKRSSFHERAHMAELRAVASDRIFEIKSERILQPGPGALFDGANELFAIVSAVAHDAGFADFVRHREDGVWQVSGA